ncbi:MAG TPA: helix-turn-helix domain-containing protein [Solirubrobacterales bacterium]|nr:helix-turn-helix domain-containing protein [Solirubrobacterales bacterium]
MSPAANDDWVVLVRSHPARSIILARLRDGGELSPKEAAHLPEIARLFGGGPSQITSGVSYHFKMLAKADLLTVARREKIRGSVKNFYTITERGKNFPADTLILDQIAELLRSKKPTLKEVRKLVASSGRRVS